MATGDSIFALEDMKKALMASVDQLQEEIASGVTISKDLPIDADASIETLEKTKLLIESELEALLHSELLDFPEDQDTLLEYAQQDALSTSLNNERTSELYEHKVLEVQEELDFYNTIIEKATKVDKVLDNLAVSQSKKNAMIQLKKKLDESAIVFRTLRGELQYILGILYPGEDENPSLENLLEPLVSKLLTDPQDPYITISPETPDAHVAFLLRANFIRRHPEDATKYRYLDTRF
ncbi:centromere protein K-like [Palaemon carinicauda]|uniref:centromere protein K-like n=1 Tax=Palaemon carinicauda TaxID=392227 RepID=UPI0035B5C65A